MEKNMESQTDIDPQMKVNLETDFRRSILFLELQEVLQVNAGMWYREVSYIEGMTRCMLRWRQDFPRRGQRI